MESNEVSRRHFLAAGAGTIALGIVDNCCTPARASLKLGTHHIPADKNLDPAWVERLFAKGTHENLCGRGAHLHRHARGRNLRGAALPPRRRDVGRVGHLQCRSFHRLRRHLLPHLHASVPRAAGLWNHRDAARRLGDIIARSTSTAFRRSSSRANIRSARSITAASENDPLPARTSRWKRSARSSRLMRGNRQRREPSCVIAVDNTSDKTVDVAISAAGFKTRSASGTSDATRPSGQNRAVRAPGLASLVMSIREVPSTGRRASSRAGSLCRLRVGQLRRLEENGDRIRRQAGARARCPISSA